MKFPVTSNNGSVPVVFGKSLKRIPVLVVSLVCQTWVSAQPVVDFTHGPLKVSENRRYLIHEDGTPFFYLGDTNWELFHRATREEAVQLIENRREKGFSVMQTVALAFLDGLTDPNPYGDLPLIAGDPARPAVTQGNRFSDPEEYDYWDHVDFILETAAEHGIYIGFIPTWTVHVKNGVVNEDNARRFGRFLGERFGKHENIIWILGGDNRPSYEEALWREMAGGIREGDTGSHLMTYHPRGGQKSSQWFHEEDWLDFNMIQSGHQSRDYPNYEKIAEDYALRPIKPTMDGEPRYEDHSVSWRPANGWFQPFDVRQAAYWSLFAGAHGHTYGCRGVWQMYSDRYEAHGPLNHHWYVAINLPAAWDMKHVRDLMLSRPFLERIPDQSLIRSHVQYGAGRQLATRGKGYLFVYSPIGNVFRLQMGVISGYTVVAWWFNPSTGEATRFATFPNTGEKEFDPPGESARGNDWVLVLDDASLEFPAPGSVDMRYNNQ